MLVWSSEFTMREHNITYHAMNFFDVILQLWMFSSSEATSATEKFHNVVMGILDLSIQFGPGFCFVVTIDMNFIHMSFKICLQSKSEVTLATYKFLNFVMGILDMSRQIGPGFSFVVTMSTRVTPNIAMNFIHMSFKI